MARKLRTGFELPFANNGASGNKNLSWSDSYVLKDLVNGGFSSNFSSTRYDGNLSVYTGSNIPMVRNDTNARTLSNGTRGCYLWANNDYNLLSFDVTKFTSGFYANHWFLCSSIGSMYQKLFFCYDGTDYYHCYHNSKSGDNKLYIQKNGSDVANVSLSLSSNTWYNCIISLDNTGQLDVTVNGTTVPYNTSVTFSNWQKIGACYIASFIGQYISIIDDLAINDGSGASDNSTPNSIRGYNFFDSATLNTNSGFSAVGGTTVLANLQDGSDSTRASASADLSYLDFSLPTLSGTGMSETAANFTKIEAINVYGRQIEATKASSLLKAKVTDTVAVVNREENLSLPLTVGNDSVTMFDDGSSDWVLANLDSGDMDFRVTFDKP